jgi:hypothetical protein
MVVREDAIVGRLGQERRHHRPEGSFGRPVRSFIAVISFSDASAKVMR